MLPVLSEVCNRPVSLEEICYWDLKESLGIDEAAEEYVWEKTLGTDLLLDAPAITGAIDGISRLGRHEIWIITHRPLATQRLTESWLGQHKVRYDHIVFVEDGHKMSAGPKFDVFVEDYLVEARKFAEAGVLTLLFNQPWNQADTLPANCRRVHDWGTVVDIIKTIESLE
jgi:uncharacterized HAD superfamily protein